METDARDLLLADLEHFGEALLKNEEAGEKRFNFFVTLVTAVAAGLVALATKGTDDVVFGILSTVSQEDALRKIATVATSFLLIVGLLTYLRMLQRNRVTDQYQQTLTYIRRQLSVGFDTLSEYHVPVGRRRSHSWWRRLTGGYAQTMAILDGVLICSLAFLLEADPAAAIVSAGVGTALLLVPATKRDKGHDRSQYFRAGVGAVVFDRRGLVLSLERKDKPGEWQFPQGGIEMGEEPAAAVLREVAEETFIQPKSVSIVALYPDLLAYELPRKMRSPKTGRGQVQYWFLLEYDGDPESIDVAESKEFRSARWGAFDRVVDDAVDFRRPVYDRVRDAFADQIEPAVGSLDR